MSSSPTNNDRGGNLIWIDLEMTGLDAAADTIIEIATIVTDRHLNELAVGPMFAIGQPKTVMDSMDEWNVRQHGESGLTERVIKSDVTLRKAELATLEFLSHWVDAGVSPICGNSICQDRRFLAREMPELERYFHYRNLDV
ncbi:MAG: oligoribonuclease, partial [Gammaproteobacteria bacterium]|nr:oligoribonuclease [Gammaproteobacteria bacterium]